MAVYVFRDFIQQFQFLVRQWFELAECVQVIPEVFHFGHTAQHRKYAGESSQITESPGRHGPVRLYFLELQRRHLGQ